MDQQILIFYYCCMHMQQIIFFSFTQQFKCKKFEVYRLANRAQGNRFEAVQTEEDS